MRVYGDVEYVKLSTGERFRRVVGEGESRLESIADPSHIRLGPRQETEEELAEKSRHISEFIIAAQRKFKENSMPTLRCKMQVQKVSHIKDAEGNTTQEEVQLIAVYGQGGTANAEWSKWTPAASFNINISNPSAIGKLSSGHQYFVDFTPATPEE